MKLHGKIFFNNCVFFLSGHLFAQGFDWQYSARLPFETPKLYYGANVSYGIISSYGKITFLENRISCPNFENGNGAKFSFGINAELWNTKNQFAYIASLNYDINSLTYNSYDSVPVSETVFAKYKSELELNFSNISAAFGLKYRLLNSHFHVSGKVNLDFTITDNFNATERIANPDEIPYWERNIANGNIYDIRKITITPDISIGYDVELGRGIYATPKFSLEIPVMSMMENDSIKNLAYMFELLINFNY